LFIQLYEKEWATLYRLTTSTSQVNSESEQYWKDFVIFLAMIVQNDFLLTSLMEKFPNEVDNISTKDASSFQEVKNKFLNLHLAGGNGDSAHHTFGNKKNKKSKKGTKSSGSSSSKPGPSSSPRTPPPPQRQRLALGILNTILLKPTDMVGMSAPSLRSLISRSLRIREKGKSSILLGITQIPILRSRASFTRMLK
jgi:hypothetical protein